MEGEALQASAKRPRLADGGEAVPTDAEDGETAVNAPHKIWGSAHATDSMYKYTKSTGLLYVLILLILGLVLAKCQPRSSHGESIGAQHYQYVYLFIIWNRSGTTRAWANPLGHKPRNLFSLSIAL